jgi:threonine dehydrogenase-like Zn-dependent dehydrogenase
MTGIKGKIIMVALHKKPAEIMFRDLAYKELTIKGTRIYADGDFPKAIMLAAEGKVDLKPLISHTFPLSEAEKAFETAADPAKSCKVLLYPV